MKNECILRIILWKYCDISIISTQMKYLIFFAVHIISMHIIFSCFLKLKPRQYQQQNLYQQLGCLESFLDWRYLYNVVGLIYQIPAWRKSEHFLLSIALCLAFFHWLYQMTYEDVKSTFWWPWQWFQGFKTHLCKHIFWTANSITKEILIEPNTTSFFAIVYQALHRLCFT